MFHMTFIRDVKSKILSGRDNFKLAAGHMIVIDDRFKFPADALRFAFAVVKVQASRIRPRDQVRWVFLKLFCIAR